MTAPDPVIGIVGLGHVGRALASALAPRFRVMHCDPALAGSLEAAQLARGCAVVFVCVPTPAGAAGAADISIVQDVVAQLAHASGANPPLVVIKSTVPPGTTQALAQQHAALPLVVCPEFLRQHAAASDLAEATRIVVGLPAPAPPTATMDRLRPVWQALSPRAEVVVTDAATAELAKYATNAFLALKVTFANQMADACTVLGIDYDAFAQVLALDPRIGASHLAVPGHDAQRGFGGPCLPKDLRALLAVLGPQLPLLDAVARLNGALRASD
jgi:UDPglucose 6-dehydrogenase